MPVHDWSKVDAGTFHALHVGWVTHLSETLNGGILPDGYYAMPEQHGGRMIGDVLTLQQPQTSGHQDQPGGVAVAERPPRVASRMTPQSTARALRRTITIRHVSGHRIIALLEIVSPANKDRSATVEEFAQKVVSALWQGIHVMIVDVHKPRAHDPQGMHAEVWQAFDDEPYQLPAAGLLTVSSYVAPPPPVAYVEHPKLGSELPEMPLFLDPDHYVNIPLEQTYAAAYRGMPSYWREVLEGE